MVYPVPLGAQKGSLGGCTDLKGWESQAQPRPGFKQPELRGEGTCMPYYFWRRAGMGSMFLLLVIRSVILETHRHGNGSYYGPVY